MQKGSQRKLAFVSGEKGAGTMVSAEPKRCVPLKVARDVEFLRFGKHRRITVARAEQERNAGPTLDFHPANFQRFTRVP